MTACGGRLPKGDFGTTKAVHIIYQEGISLRIPAGQKLRRAEARTGLWRARPGASGLLPMRVIYAALRRQTEVLPKYLEV